MTGQHRKPETFRERALKATQRLLATSWPPPEPEPEIRVFPALTEETIDDA